MLKFSNSKKNDFTSNVDDSATPTRVRYPIAKASYRAIARIVDSLIVFFVCLGIALLYYHFSDVNKSIFENINNTSNIEFFCVILLTAVITFLYFIVLPYFWNGKTIMRWVLRMRLIELIRYNLFFWHLIKHDLFIWMHLTLVSLILAISGFFYSDFQTYIKSIFSLNSSGFPAIIFKLLYSICGLITLFIGINTIINSKKRAVHDFFSDTVVIQESSVSDIDTQPKLIDQILPKKSYSLPGEIPPPSFTEI